MTDSTAPESTLGDVVREARLAAGLSQETLAEMIGRSQGWLTKVERGEIPTPRDESLRRLAAVLGLNLPDLLTTHIGYAILCASGGGAPGDDREGTRT